MISWGKAVQTECGLIQLFTIGWEQKLSRLHPGVPNPVHGIAFSHVPLATRMIARHIWSRRHLSAAMSHAFREQRSLTSSATKVDSHPTTISPVSSYKITGIICTAVVYYGRSVLTNHESFATLDQHTKCIIMAACSKTPMLSLIIYELLIENAKN